ncbi:DNA-binding SARP family transcriptional activator [Kitasatospora gansuensis]|uniref:DNA-binding SARP family transcriptional activator n=1 Tax=Kitasatospora gansuensis TaxID=258050 RepID=A0A7W7SCT1_9ACTN|nr:AfsR/SARP family transcriptional regulator [Kitasatospora gansuensis]MBB4947722.1 DNA-binding SARP family transcriptional activator [Kitasatospora gansuensis]
MDFAVLGPVEVRDEQEDLTPAAAMPRRVLATLLLQAGRTVSNATLEEELWDDEPPKLARKTIQTYLYQLRKALAAGPTGGRRQLLETRPNGYRILLEPGELDLRLFEQRVGVGRSALAEGDHARAAAVLREALGLWRGGALGDLPHGPVLAAEAARLEDARLGALEQRVEADLRLGRHRELVGELKALTVRHPTREEFAAQLMLAAYRSGLQEDALSTYGRLRRSVVEYTGLEPSERLQRLHRAVLSAAPGLAAPERAVTVRTVGRGRPAEIPAAPPGLVGRESESERIRRGMGRLCSVTCVVGGPGVGKTALVTEVAQRVKERYPDGQLFVTLHGADGAPLGPAEVLSTFLRAAGLEEPPGSAEEPARSWEESARLFRSWTADRKVLVVLDDAASVQQVLPLLPSGPDCATLITARQRLAGLSGAVGVQLAALGPADGLRLLESVAGPGRIGAERAVARELVELCDLLPLAVRAAGERLAARPGLGVAELTARLRAERGRLAELGVGDLDVAGRLAEAIRRLAAGEQQALRVLAGLGGRPFGIAEAARVLGVEAGPAGLLVDRLLSAHLLADLGTEGGAAGFRLPDLVRLAGTAPVCALLSRPGAGGPAEQPSAVRYRDAGRRARRGHCSGRPALALR